MKTKNSIVTILAVLIAAIGFATETEKLSITAAEKNKAAVAFNTETPMEFEVELKNFDKETVYYYKTEIPSSAYYGKFDFSDQVNGNYLISVTCGDKNHTGEVLITEDEVKVAPVVTASVPFFVQKDDKVNLTLLNPSQKQVYINVYKNNQHIDGVKLGKEFTIQKCIDLSNLRKGDYKLVVSDNYNDHTFMVSK